MADISQRSLANLMRVLDSLVPRYADTYPLVREYWQQLLFEWEFPSWLIAHAVRRSYRWTAIIRDLYDGKVDDSHRAYATRALQDSMLVKLTAMGMTLSTSTETRELLRRSLLLDGLEVSDGHVRSVQGPVTISEEKNMLLTSLAASSFAQKDVIKKHLLDAEEHFSNGKVHSVLNESRSALQASIEDAVSLVAWKVARSSGGGVKNLIEFLTREKFLSDDEQLSFLAAWGFMCAGAHPGLPPDETGRIGMIFGLEFIQVLLIKAKNLI